MPAAKHELPPLPADPVDAMRHVYQAVRKREGERAQLAEAVRAELKAVKEKSETSPASVREAARIGRMTPERRIKWEDRLNGSLSLLGYTQIVLQDNPASARTNSAAAARQEIERIEGERRELGDEIAGYYRAAKDKGLNVPEIKLFVRMSRQADSIEITEWFDRVDQTAKDLGIWDAAAGGDAEPYDN